LPATGIHLPAEDPQRRWKAAIKLVQKTSAKLGIASLGGLDRALSKQIRIPYRRGEE
jgi:hypothetical protein